MDGFLYLGYLFVACNNLWILIVLFIWHRSGLTFLLTYVVVWSLCGYGQRGFLLYRIFAVEFIFVWCSSGFVFFWRLFEFYAFRAFASCAL